MSCSTTARDVFNASMALIDNKSTANYDANNSEYAARALDLLNILRVELYPFSDSFSSESGGRPAPKRLRAMTDVIQLDDAVCQSVMPYGLAAHLLLSEDPNAADFLQQRYEELRARLARGYPQEWEAIEDVYGNQYNDYGSW